MREKAADWIVIGTAVCYAVGSMLRARRRRRFERAAWKQLELMHGTDGESTGELLCHDCGIQRMAENHEETHTAVGTGVEDAD